MFSLTADDNTLLKTVELFVEPVEVYDAEGKLLGLFVPANMERGKQLYAQGTALLDWTEIERRKQANEEGYPFEVVKERLQLLQGEIERRNAAGERELTEDEGVEFIHRVREQEPQCPAS